jgi:26S proteasome regulatory subunit N10
MSLEATLIMMDNSAFGINGDYEPTRWESEVDCASLLIQAKLEANQQSSVGVGLIGGGQVQILCTLTSDSVKANSFLFGVKCSGELHFTQVIVPSYRPSRSARCRSSTARMRPKSSA